MPWAGGACAEAGSLPQDCREQAKVARLGLGARGSAPEVAPRHWLLTHWHSGQRPSTVGWERIPLLLGALGLGAVQTWSYKDPWELSLPAPSFPRASCRGPEDGRNLLTITENVSDAGSPGWVQCATPNLDRDPGFPQSSP